MEGLLFLCFLALAIGGGRVLAFRQLGRGARGGDRHAAWGSAGCGGGGGGSLGVAELGRRPAAAAAWRYRSSGPLAQRRYERDDGRLGQLVRLHGWAHRRPTPQRLAQRRGVRWHPLRRNLRLRVPARVRRLGERHVRREQHVEPHPLRVRMPARSLLERVPRVRRAPPRRLGLRRHTEQRILRVCLPSGVCPHNRGPVPARAVAEPRQRRGHLRPSAVHLCAGDRKHLDRHCQ